LRRPQHISWQSFLFVSINVTMFIDVIKYLPVALLFLTTVKPNDFMLLFHTKFTTSKENLITPPWSVTADLTVLCGQFHQHFTSTFLVRKCFFYQNVTREKLCKAFSYKKCTSKMLMKLTPANHTNWRTRMESNLLIKKWGHPQQCWCH